MYGYMVVCMNVFSDRMVRGLKRYTPYYIWARIYHLCSEMWTKQIHSYLSIVIGATPGLLWRYHLVEKVLYENTVVDYQSSVTTII